MTKLSKIAGLSRILENLLVERDEIRTGLGERSLNEVDEELVEVRDDLQAALLERSRVELFAGNNEKAVDLARAAGVEEHLAKTMRENLARESG